MRGFVLAAGFGTRLKPLTDHIPKALVPVCGKPLLERALESFTGPLWSALGANAHYRADDIFAFQKKSPIPFSVFHEEPEIRGTGGAFDFARDFLGGDDSFAIVNADIVTDIDITEQAYEFLVSGALVTLVAAPRKGNGTVCFDPDTSAYKGTGGEGSIPGTIAADFIGIAFYRKEFLGYVRSDDFSIVPVWKRVADAGQKVTVSVLPNCQWYDTGTASQLLAVHFDVLSGAFTLPVSESVDLDIQTGTAYAANMRGHFSSENRNVWVGQTSVSMPQAVHDVVLLDNAVLSEPLQPYSLYTPWGRIADEQ